MRRIMRRVLEGEVSACVSFDPGYAGRGERGGVREWWLSVSVEGVGAAMKTVKMSRDGDPGALPESR